MPALVSRSQIGPAAWAAVICGSVGVAAHGAADLGAQLEPVDPALPVVGDRVDLDVVVVGAVDQDAALGVAAVQRVGQLRLQDVVGAGVVGRLQDAAGRRRSPPW